LIFYHLVSIFSAYSIHQKCEVARGLLVSQERYASKREANASAKTDGPQRMR